MESNSVEETSVVQEMNVFQKIVGIFTSPAKTFASIDLKPTILVPLLLIIAVNLVFVFTAGDVIKTESLTRQEQAMQERGMDPDQIDDALARTEKFMGITMPAFSVVGPVVVLVVIAGVFLFVGNVILGGKTTFKKVMSVATWSWLVVSLYSLVMLPIVLAKESLQVSFSLATFMSEDARQSFLYNLLAKVDIFYIWWLVVFSIGLAVIYKMRIQKTATAVFITYAIYALVTSSLAGLFS